MAFLPVVTREMNVLSRRKSTYRARSVTAITAVLTMMWLLLVSASRVSVAQMGSTIFLILSGFCFGFALLVGMHATSDCVSEEKREGTLGLLFLTDLRGLHIIAGKMAASSLNALFAVLGVVPMIALAILLGGVTLSQILKVALVLVNSMFLSLSLGVFVSTLSKNERKAMFACFVGLFIIAVMPFIVSLALSEFDGVYPQLVCLSPIYSFVCFQVAPGKGFNSDYFYPSLLIQNALAWLLLGGASRILPRCVNELPALRFKWLRTWVDNYVYGRREQRARYRASLLDRNAFLWLASRERVKPRYAWGIVAFFGLLFFWVAWQFPAMFFDPPIALTIVFLVHFVLKIWVASEVCSRLINDRRSGALELLLSSPLRVRDITDGQAMALRRIFCWPVLALVLGELGMMLATMRERPQFASEARMLYLAAITTLLLDLWALKWVGMWLSLFGKSIERVLLASLGRILAIPWIVFALIAATLNAIVALQNERMPASVVYGLWWGISVAIAGLFGILARRNILDQFRAIAAQQHQAGEAADMPEPNKAPEPRRGPGLWRALPPVMRRHWLITGSTAFVGALLLVAVTRQLYWKHQLSKEIARIRSLKEPAGPAEIGRVYPLLPSNADAFAHLGNAGRINWGRWVQPKAGVQLLARAKSGDTNVVRECQQILGKNQAQLAALHELDRFNQARIDPLVMDVWGLTVDIPGYLALAAADIVLALHNHEDQRAREDLRALLRMTELLHAQPLALTQDYCRYSVMTLNAALELNLSSAVLSPADLLEIQLALERISALNPLPKILRMERARMLSIWGRPDPRGWNQIPAPVSAALGLFSFVGSKDKLLVTALKEYGDAIERSSGLRSKAEPSFLQSGVAPNLLVMFTSPWPVRSQISSIVAADITIQAQLGLARAAVAAERYRRVRGAYPASLEALVPTFLDAVPKDPYTDQPIRCEEVSGGLRIQLAAPAANARTEPQEGFLEIRLNHPDLTPKPLIED